MAGWFDKMVNAAEGVANTIQSELTSAGKEVAPAPPEEPPPSASGSPADPEEDATAPTPAMKKALASGASFAIGTSKKALDFVVSYVRPTLRTDSILDPHEIRRVLTAAEEAEVPIQLRFELALNHPETVPEARVLFEEACRVFRNALEAAERDRPGESSIANPWTAALEAWTGEDSIIRLRLEASEAVVSGDGPGVRRLARRCLEVSPEFNNPLVATSMLDPALGGDLPPDQRRAWIERALFYHPTDAPLLRSLGEVLGDPEKRMIGQLAELVDEG